MKLFKIALIILLLILTGCMENGQAFTETTSPTTEYTKTITIIKETPTLQQLVLPKSSETEESVFNIIEVSSPLEDYPLLEIVNLISNQFNPPSPGSDDPHQGVDFSVIDPTLRIALKGSPIQVILDGKVVMLMSDRFPYGNAVMVETPFENLPETWREKLLDISKPESWGKQPALTCPAGWDRPASEMDELSLYVLYAHLDNEPDHLMGDEVVSGDKLGEIGDSGNVLAPHLHLEMRIGFTSGLKGSMAHYDVSAKEEEMENYCRWRVSGWYRVVDPMDLLSTDPGY
jgi:murein DD-endopeptidase MepM/ murein hydrolase activator NlpD